MLYIYIKSVNSNWSKASINFTVSLFRFCFPDGSIDESGMLKSPTIIVLGAMCALVKFLLRMRVPLHLEHRCSELRVLLVGFFL